jgi:flavin reductase (DIM6/NTAB) family NADH-FMN oxidoreductase RutF
MDRIVNKKDIGAKVILYPTPVLVVAVYDGDGKPNAMTAAWGGICCSDPPCVAFSLRKATYTYKFLVDNKAATVNVPTRDYVVEADYFGIASGRNEDKIAAAGLTPVKSDYVYAPYIKEFPLNLECKIIHIIDLGLHTQFVGEVMNIKVDESISNDESRPMIEQIKPIIFAPGSSNYYAVGEEIGKAFSDGKALLKRSK